MNDQYEPVPAVTEIRRVLYVDGRPVCEVTDPDKVVWLNHRLYADGRLVGKWPESFAGGSRWRRLRAVLRRVIRHGA